MSGEPMTPAAVILSSLSFGTIPILKGISAFRRSPFFIHENVPSG
jgi:hypothetical protein